MKYFLLIVAFLSCVFTIPVKDGAANNLLRRKRNAVSASSKLWPSSGATTHVYYKFPKSMGKLLRISVKSAIKFLF